MVGWELVECFPGGTEGKVRCSKGEVWRGRLGADIVGLPCWGVGIVKDCVAVELLLECSASCVWVLCGEPGVIVCV